MPVETIVMAGGGTGGHVFPMIAVADELRSIAPALRIVFVGTERGIERQIVPERGYELKLVSIAPIRGQGPWGALAGVRKAIGSLPEGYRLLRELRPKVVFSMGGYAAGSVSVAARMLGIPLALMEPNSVMGLTNRAMARWVTRAYTAYGEIEKAFPAGTVRRTGVPLRRGFEPKDYPVGDSPLQVLVLGGSQGAQSLNEALPRAFAQTQVPVRVVHQAGKGKDNAVRALYQELGAAEQAEVVPFIRDVPRALADAHLVIARSGAGAVSEICAVGRPSLLVPYPFASGDHQYHNAQALVRAGAALCIRNDLATADRLAAELEALVASGRLPVMARAARALGRPEAAETIALDLIEQGNVHLDESAQDDDDGFPGDGDNEVPSEVH